MIPCNEIIITDGMLSVLRESLKARMSGFRLAHTLGVEEMAARMHGFDGVIFENYIPKKNK